jgi:ribonucleoside-diphosphate reductase alpha chain
MEEFLPQPAQRTISSEIEGVVQETLVSMGHPEIAKAFVKIEAGEPKAKVVERETAPPSREGEPQLSANALRVLEKRYLAKDSQGKVIETPEQMFRRVAHVVADAELVFDPKVSVSDWEEKFYQLMVDLDFLPNSPTLMNAGRELGQLSACFVLPIDDSMESIFEAVNNTAMIHKSGGGTGFSFSRLRPESDRVGSTGGIASGPVSFIRVFDTATDVIKQGGTRRGANMAILNIDHPDILKFITAKQTPGAFTNFNFSVAATEEFMKAVEADAEYDLINPHTKEVAGKLKAKEVFDKIVDSAWRTGDPGIIFLDRINRDNSTPQLGNIESTNPCGEQPLLPFESCNLGSVNLARMLRYQDGREAKVEVDYPKLAEVVRTAVRFLDDVVEVNKFPLPEIEEATKATRKIGLGVMGFADMLFQIGMAYDSGEAIKLAEEVMSFINQEALQASIKLAKRRGVFPAFKGSIYDVPGGDKVRNAARTTIAPTGTLSIIAGCSSGIEPLFALCYTRTILEGEHLIEVNPYFEEVAKSGSLKNPQISQGEKREGFYSEELMRELERRGGVHGMEEVPEEIQKVFVTAHEVSPEWHVQMQAVFQKYTDNAVSKTINFPYESTQDDIAKAFLLAYQLGCKGITIYRDRSKETQVLNIAKEEETPATGGALLPRTRPRKTQGFTERVSTGCGHIYVTVNRDEKGIFEVFSTLGKAGGCAEAQLEAISRLISLSLRAGVAPASIVRNLRGIRCPSIAWEEGHAILSCPDAIGSVLENEVGIEKGDREAKSLSPFSISNPQTLRSDIGQCPECGSSLVYQEGCHFCPLCGYTRCD